MASFSTVFCDGGTGDDRSLVPQRCHAMLRKGRAAPQGFVSLCCLLIQIESAKFCEQERNRPFMNITATAHLLTHYR